MSIKEQLISYVYPNRCFICDAVLPYPEELCDNCKKVRIDYRAIKGAICDICALRLTDCNCRTSRFYDKAVFPYFYENDVRKALHKLKFRGRLDKIKPFSKAAADAIKERDINDIDIISFIPMGIKSKKKRGYNQAELLCEEISKELNVKSLPLLYKTGENNKQHDLKMAERQGNILGIFEPDKTLLKEIEGKNILIVDDIMTTGATLNEAAKTLLIFGADTVYAAAAAARPKKKSDN